jgi:hypothetical protein
MALCREVRDLVDLVMIHNTILPLGAVVWAAAEKSPGFTPEGVIAEIRRNANYPASEWHALQTSQPLDPTAIMTRLRTALDDAEAFVSRMPTDAAGLLFLRGSEVVQPDPDRLQDYHTHAGQRRGQWPSTTEITAAMFERAALEKAYQPGLTIRVDDAALEQQRQRQARDSHRPSTPSPQAAPALPPPSEAVLRSLAEQERKRLLVIRTPIVRRFEARDQGLVQFGRVEQIEGKPFALVHRQEETVVLALDAATARRLAALTPGHSLHVGASGAIRFGKGRRR